MSSVPLLYISKNIFALSDIETSSSFVLAFVNFASIFSVGVLVLTFAKFIDFEPNRVTIKIMPNNNISDGIPIFFINPLSNLICSFFTSNSLFLSFT